jgi:DNA polymerase-3 subunit epsilon
MSNQNPPRRIWNLNRTSGVSLNNTLIYEAQTAQQMAFIRAMMKEKRRQELFEIQLIEFEAVVFDLETTGFSPQNGDEIISIGAIAVKGKELLEHEKFYTMVNPNRNVPKHIEELTGISEKMVHEAPKLIEALTRFFEFVRRRTLIAHGTGHDKQFLNTALWKTSRVNLTNRVLDTMLIGKWLLPKLENYSLDHLLQVFGVGISNRHHALEDSVMTAQLWSKYMEELQARRITTLGDLYTKISMNTSFF